MNFYTVRIPYSVGSNICNDMVRDLNLHVSNYTHMNSPRRDINRVEQ